jgi:hypothetical protein
MSDDCLGARFEAFLMAKRSTVGLTAMGAATFIKQQRRRERLAN